MRVVGRGGAYSTAGQFQLNVAKEGTSCSNVTLGNTVRADNTSYTLKNTVILTDASVISPSAAKLDLLAANSRVNGIIVDVNLDQRVKDLKAQALANPTCPYAVNLVAEEIKRIVDSYRNANALRYVVIAGNDSVIPFFRYPDQSLLGQESGYVPPVGSNTISEGSLRNDMVLSQDAYGAGTQISVRTSNFPIPGLAVGRLVETPADMAGLIDAFIASPTTGLVPGTGLVSGYDFLSDAANAVATELTTGGVTVDGTLIAPNNISPQDPAAWKATDLGQKLLGTARNDVIFLAGHFSANSALAADFTTSLFTSQLDASTTNFTNAIVFSAGCHSGYNIADGDAILEPHAAARLGAGVRAQRGDADRRHRLPVRRHRLSRVQRAHLREFRAPVARRQRGYRGVGRRSAGQGQARLPRDDAGHPRHPREGAAGSHAVRPADARCQHVGRSRRDGWRRRRRSTRQRARAASAGSARAQDARQDHRRPRLRATRRTSRTSSMCSTRSIRLRAAIVTATWYSGLNGVVTNPAEPVLPLQTYNIGAADPSLVVRGVGFRGGQFADSRYRSPHGRADHRAARRARAVRLAGVLSDANVDRELFRRARRQRRHQPARHARTASREGHRARHQHAAQVRQPRPARVLQRQPHRAVDVGCAEHRSREWRRHRWQHRFHCPGRGRSEGRDRGRMGHLRERRRQQVAIARPQAVRRAAARRRAPSRIRRRGRARSRGCPRGFASSCRRSTASAS